MSLRQELRSIPNMLSILRLILVPVFLWLLLNDHMFWALFVLAFAGASDWLDGQIARRYNQVTELGRVLDPEEDRRLALIGAFQLGKKGGIGAGVDHLERQIKRLDPFLVKAAPGDRAAQIAPFRGGFGGGERLGAVFQRFPVRQAGAFLLHVGRIPPLFLGLHAGRADVLDLAGGGRGIHRLAARGLPHLHRDMEIAGLEARELGEKDRRPFDGAHVIATSPLRRFGRICPR